MQSDAYMAWLRERNLEHSGFKIPTMIDKRSTPSASRIFAGVFTVLLVIVVSVVFLR
jgi:hypothetical protein